MSQLVPDAAEQFLKVVENKQSKGIQMKDSDFSAKAFLWE